MPKWGWLNQDVTKTYQVVPKWDWPMWDVKRMHQVIPKRDGPTWEVAKTYDWDLGFVKVKSLLTWTIYFHINSILFSNRTLLSGATLHKWRPHLAKMIFSIWKPSKTYTWRWSTYILFRSNVKHSSQNTVYRRPCWDVKMASQLLREWDGPICDVYATFH